MKNKSLVIAVVALVVAVVAGIIAVAVPKQESAEAVGAIGTNAIENYVPAIKYNDGYYSELDITTTGTITGASISGAVSASTLTTTATSTLGGNLVITTSNTATSTAIIGCIQSYATSTATPWRWLTVASSTQIAPGYNGLILAQYGNCPRI